MSPKAKRCQHCIPANAPAARFWGTYRRDDSDVIVTLRLLAVRDDDPSKAQKLYYRRNRERILDRRNRDYALAQALEKL